MRRAVLKRIHVNQHQIRANQKNDDHQPPLRVKAKGRNLPAHEIVIEGPARVIYRPDKPLSCGARVWIETRSQVIVMRDDHDDFVVT